MELVQLKSDLFVPTDFGKYHHYYADAEGQKEYTGITSILGVLAKPALIQWAANEAERYIRDHVSYAIPGEDGGYWAIKPSVVEEARTAHARKKDKAAEHGTDAHALVEEWVNWLLQRAEGDPSEVLKYPVHNEKIEPFVKWARENVDHFIFAERRMANRELFVAGTADFACVMKDGKTLMGDFKTSSGIYGIDYWLQVAAYRLLAEGEGDAPYDGSVIVRLGKKGPSDFEVRYLYEYETFRDAFLACLKIYRAQASIKGLTIH